MFYSDLFRNCYVVNKVCECWSVLFLCFHYLVFSNNLWIILYIVCELLREVTGSAPNSVKPVVLHRLLGTLWIENLETWVLWSVLSVTCSITLNKSLSHLETWFSYFKIKGLGLDDLVLLPVIHGILIFGERKCYL